MQAFSNSDKINSLVAPHMEYLITFIDNNGKLDIYIGGNFRGLCRYPEIFGALTNLTSSGQSSHYFGPSSSTKNDTPNIHTVIAALRVQQRIIFQ